jgi:hypothetical protein
MYVGFDDIRHWVTVYRDRLGADAPPIEMRICTRFRTGDTDLPGDVLTHKGIPFAFGTRLLTSGISMLLMRLIIGIVVVFASVLGGYMALGGHLEVLFQPFEAVIILGAAIGAFIIGNSGAVLKQTLGIFGTLFRGPRYNKAAYVELLGCSSRSSSWCSPRACWRSSSTSRTRTNRRCSSASRPSPSQPPRGGVHVRLPAHGHARGQQRAHEMEALMDEELETHHQEQRPPRQRRAGAG